MANTDATGSVSMVSPGMVVSRHMAWNVSFWAAVEIEDYTPGLRAHDHAYVIGIGTRRLLYLPALSNGLHLSLSTYPHQHGTTGMSNVANDMVTADSLRCERARERSPGSPEDEPLEYASTDEEEKVAKPAVFFSLTRQWNDGWSSVVDNQDWNPV